ncbi:MAG: flagellar biosynthetic protein FliR [Bryobacterales bacterium]|nr:flagellar biosynthetic protein FliR [Bryobacterales bacterium]
MGGAVAFVPLPGFRTAPMVPKIVLTIALTIALLPQWLGRQQSVEVITQVIWWLPAEAALGITIGVFAGWLIEALVMAMQFLSLQAGYSYAAMVDPATQADSGVLPVFGQLFASLLFFGVGFDRELLRIFGATLDLLPPGAWRLTPALGAELIHFSGQMITLAVRIALPLVGLLVLIDLSLALLGRVQSQLQLLSLAFPVKMLVSMAVMAVLAGSFGPLFQSASADLSRTLWQIVHQR